MPAGTAISLRRREGRRPLIPSPPRGPFPALGAAFSAPPRRILSDFQRSIAVRLLVFCRLPRFCSPCGERFISYHDNSVSFSPYAFQHTLYIIHSAFRSFRLKDSVPSNKKLQVLSRSPIFPFILSGSASCSAIGLQLASSAIKRDITLCQAKGFAWLRLFHDLRYRLCFHPKYILLFSSEKPCEKLKFF